MKRWVTGLLLLGSMNLFASDLSETLFEDTISNLEQAGLSCEYEKTVENLKCIVVSDGCRVHSTYICTDQDGEHRATVKKSNKALKNGANLDIKELRQVRVKLY